MKTETSIQDHLALSGRRRRFVAGNFPRWRDRIRPLFRREPLALLVLLLVAGALRVGLAVRGWEYVNSDEGLLGLMADDILRRGAHPAFMYGQHYLGALQAYLAAPFFAVLGPTNAALHVTTTVQTLSFLLILYLFVRQVYSPGVAWCSVALLALGPESALLAEMHAGTHTQDLLFFGALLFWLVFLRLRQPWSGRRRTLLNLSIGLVAGVSFWCTFLMTPFILAAGLPLVVETIRRRRMAGTATRRLCRQVLTLVLGAVVGAAPLIIVTIATRGVVVGEVFSASQATTAPGALPSGPLGILLLPGLQAAATLLIGLPHTLGSLTVCVPCSNWPAPNTTASPADALRSALFSVAFSGVAITLWLIAACPLARDAWLAFRSARQRASTESSERVPSAASRQWGDARWWGRAMFVTGGALTVLEYTASRSSYLTANSAARYLVGVYLCTPLIADLLWRGSRQVWHWLAARKSAAFGRAHPRLPALAATGLLLAVFALNILGIVNAFHETTDRQVYGVPAGQTDAQLLSFLESHGATRFYTTYSSCYRLMFEAQQHVICAVVQPHNPFAVGVDRVPDYTQAVTAAPHPAYVFDLTGNDVQPDLPSQVAERIAAGDPRFAGYTKIEIAHYLIYYYVGPS